MADQPQRLRHWIGGQWVESASTDLLDVVNPATGQTIAEVALAPAGEVGAAVDAA